MHVARPRHQRTHAVQVHKVRSVGPDEPARRQQPLQPGQGDPHHSHAGIGVDQADAIPRLHVLDALGRHGHVVFVYGHEDARHGWNGLRPRAMREPRADPAHRLAHTRRGKRLQQVVGCAQIEGRRGVIGISGREDHLGPDPGPDPGPQQPADLDAVRPGHAHVQTEEVWSHRLDRLERGAARLALADGLYTGTQKQLAQMRPRAGFVIGDDRAQAACGAHGAKTAGMLIAAMVPAPSRPRSRSLAEEP